MKATVYMPFLSDEKPFCAVFTCAEFATWACYQPEEMKHPIMLCNDHKWEREREESLTVEGKEGKVEQIEADVGSVLQDVDPDDANALWERCSQVVDAIHEGRL